MGAEVPRFSLCWYFLLVALTFLWQVQFVMGKPFRFPEFEGPMKVIGGNTAQKGIAMITEEPRYPDFHTKSVITFPIRCPTNYILVKEKCRKRI